jgi:2-oxoglutarate ferredoxin oxidoreductase subunit beta
VSKALEWGDEIPIGVIYEEDLPVYEDRMPALSKGPLVRHEIDPTKIETLLAEFA